MNFVTCGLIITLDPPRKLHSLRKSVPTPVICRPKVSAFMLLGAEVNL